MLLRDYLRRVGVLKDRTGRKQTTEDTKTDLRTPFSKDRRQDMGPVVPRPEDKRAYLVMFPAFGMSPPGGANTVWLRFADKTYEVGPKPPGRTRTYVSGSGGMLNWSGKDKVAIAGLDVLPSPSVLLVELLRVADASGKIIVSGNTVPWNALRTYTLTKELLLNKAVPAGPVGYFHPAPALSGIIYTAAQTAPWITSTTLLGNCHDYDGLPLTPANTWEFRCISSNESGGNIIKPPPDIIGRNVVSRVITNGAFDASDIFSPPQFIEVHAFTSDVPVSGGGTSPDLSPAHGATNASKWTAVSASPTTVSRHIDAIAPGQDGRLSHWGIGGRAGTEEVTWVLLIQEFTLDHHRYRRSTSHVWKTRIDEHNGVDNYSQTAPDGRILQSEKMDTESWMIRALLDGAVVYDDAAGLTYARNAATDDVEISPTSPTRKGVLSAIRQRMILEPFVPGTVTLFKMAADRWHPVHMALAQPGGKFRVVLWKGNRDNAYVESHMASQDGSFLIAGFPNPDNSPTTQGVDITEVDGRIWVAS